VSWQTAPLSALGSVGRGKSRHRPRNDSSLYGGPYPFFQTGDVTAADFYLYAYTQSYNEKGLAQSKIWEPETLCITIAANIAETAILKIPGCFPDSIVGFRADGSKSDVRFVKYALDVAKRDFQTISKGTTQDNLSVEKLLSINLPAPPLETQRRIADILSAYDDLIENNTRRIAILEDMARRLFEEWFVQRRGLPSIAAPVEWREFVMGELFSFTGGGDWGSEEPTRDESEAVTVIRGTDFDDFDGGRAIRSPVRFISQKSFQKRRLQVGDIVVENSINAKSRTAGKTLLITDGILQACSGRAIGASFCKQYRPIEPSWSSLIYLYMKGQFERGELAYFQNVAANGIAQCLEDPRHSGAHQDSGLSSGATV